MPTSDLKHPPHPPPHLVQVLKHRVAHTHRRDLLLQLPARAAGCMAHVRKRHLAPVPCNTPGNSTPRRSSAPDCTAAAAATADAVAAVAIGTVAQGGARGVGRAWDRSQAGAGL